MIRDAIEAFADGPEKPSMLDAIGHLVGCLDDDGPADLATNPEHMEGLGLDDAQRRLLKRRKAKK